MNVNIPIFQKDARSNRYRNNSRGNFRSQMPFVSIAQQVYLPPIITHNYVVNNYSYANFPTQVTNNNHNISSTIIANNNKVPEQFMNKQQSHDSKNDDKDSGFDPNEFQDFSQPPPIIPLHSEKKGHDKDKCKICQDAIASMLSVPPELMKDPSHGYKEYNLFSTPYPNLPFDKNSKPADFQFAKFERHQYANLETKEKAKQSFTLNIDLENVYFNGISSVLILNPIQEEEPSKFYNEDFDDVPKISENFNPVIHSTPQNSFDKVVRGKFSRPPPPLPPRFLKKQVVVSDPRLSSRHDSVVPGLNSNARYMSMQQQQQQRVSQRMVHITNSISLQYYCNYCVSINQHPDICKSHSMKDIHGRVTCPLLRIHACPICGARGDFAHIKTQCPKRRFISSVLNGNRRF